MQDFCRDVRRVGGGGIVLAPDVVAGLLAQASESDDVLGTLTQRRREVLALIAEGRSNAAIARKLSISEKAVVRHASHIYDSLGLVAIGEDHRRVLAVVRYLTG